MGQAYEDLDKSHESYSSLDEEAVIESEGDYIGESLCLFLDTQITYSWVSKRKKRAQAIEGFEAAESRVIAGMQIFKRSCKVLTKLSREKSISFGDMRTKLGKIVTQFDRLSTKGRY